VSPPVGFSKPKRKVEHSCLVSSTVSQAQFLEMTMQHIYVVRHRKIKNKDLLSILPLSFAVDNQISLCF